MNLAEGVPNYICIRSAATNENMFLQVMDLPEHGIPVFYKGYNRYSLLSKMGPLQQVFFTWKKDNALYEVVRDFDCSHAQDILKDQLISPNFK